MIGAREERETRQQTEVSPSEDKSARKTYQTPELVDWGSLVDLTRGSIPFSIEDPDAMGASTGI